jgi:hypothetical protein
MRPSSTKFLSSKKETKENMLVWRTGELIRWLPILDGNLSVPPADNAGGFFYKQNPVVELNPLPGKAQP